MDDFILSQTALKKWETGCRRKWFGMWIEKSIPFYSNLKMDYGKYFEYHAIGGSAKDKDIVTDLPRVRGNKKSAAHIRIDEQVERFKELFDLKHEDYLGLKILETQKVVWSKDKTRRGVEDARCFDEFNDTEVILDLKLTSDTDLTMHNNHWGHSDDSLDTTQSEFYTDIEYENTERFIPFTYLVFDYSPRKNIKRVDVTPNHKNNFIEIKKRIHDFRTEMPKSSFPEIPHKTECDSCPIKNCASRVAEFIYN